MVVTVINASTHNPSLEAWRMITLQRAVPHLSINDICDVAWGQERQSNKLEHVWQIGLSLFSVVFDPV